MPFRKAFSKRRNGSLAMRPQVHLRGGTRRCVELFTIEEWTLREGGQRRLGVTFYAARRAPAGTGMHNLENAIARLNEDFERVEFWAAAMDALLEPVPEYELPNEAFALPQRRARARPRPAKE